MQVDFEKDSRFKNEREFKRHIANTILNPMWGYGKYKSECSIGNAKRGPFGSVDFGNFAYVDFVSHEHKILIECKQTIGSADVTRGLGQCLLYRRFLPAYKSFLVFDDNREHPWHNLLEYCELCWQYDVVLCGSRAIENEIGRSLFGAIPGILERYRDSNDRHSHGQLQDRLERKRLLAGAFSKVA